MLGNIPLGIFCVPIIPRPAGKPDNMYIFHNPQFTNTNSDAIIYEHNVLNRLLNNHQNDARLDLGLFGIIFTVSFQ